ncbi:MAG: hypothetical protein MJK08_03980 [Campylobacterales bacterium]|nr:hypothetical protein [Campylobacterales bacterium]
MLKNQVHKDDISYEDLSKIVLPKSSKMETFDLENDPNEPAFKYRDDRWILLNNSSWDINEHLKSALKRVQICEDGVYKKRTGTSSGARNNSSKYFEEIQTKRAYEPASVAYAKSVEQRRNNPQEKIIYRRNGIFIHKSLNNLSVEKMSEASIDETINIRETTNVPLTSNNKLILELQDENKNILHTKEIKTSISNEKIVHTFKIQDLLNEKEINTEKLAFLNARIEIQHDDVDFIEEQCIKINTNVELTGYWTNKNKTQITQANLNDKEDVYFYIQSKNIQDGTQAVLTVMEKDYIYDDKITSLIFTINDNKAFIKIEFKKIKHNIIKTLDEEAIVS